MGRPVTPEQPQPFSLVLTFEGSERSVQLEPGGRLHIGRHPSNDLQVRDASVSRFHAIVWWNEILDRPVLQDCGSSNGTFLDGAPVGEDPVTLRGGESLQVGHVRLSVDLRCEGMSAPALLPDDVNEAMLFTDRGPDLHAFAKDGPQLHRQLLAVERAERTGAFTVQRSGFEGTLTFCLGRVVAAEASDGLGGEEALSAVLGCAGGALTFSRSFEPVEATLDVSIRRRLEQAQPETRSFERLPADPAAWGSPSVEAAGGEAASPPAGGNGTLWTVDHEVWSRAA